MCRTSTEEQLLEQFRGAADHSDLRDVTGRAQRTFDAVH